MYLHRDRNQIEVTVAGKVNLFLEILAKRSDGFHELEMFMATVSVFDTLRFRPLETPQLQFHCRWGAGLEAWGNSLRQQIATCDLFGTLPKTEENLAHRALVALRSAAGVTAGAEVELVKRIPAAAGLGGASADAAAALVAANIGWGLQWSRERLAELAGTLGSDVPFFLFGQTAVCRGRGEQILPQRGFPVQRVVILRPPEGLSTPVVFRHCRPTEVPRILGPLLEKFATGDRNGIQHAMVNALEGPARELSPWVAALQQRMERESWVAHQMSGSGTSCFGLARSARHARRLAGQWRTAPMGAVMLAHLPAG
jgi:4-diphosphocytidyl-2-C-methyl-D-erythritol kinase